MIAPSDVSLIYATDSIEQAIEHIRTEAIEPFGLERVAASLGLASAGLRLIALARWVAQRNSYRPIEILP